MYICTYSYIFVCIHCIICVYLSIYPSNLSTDPSIYLSTHIFFFLSIVLTVLVYMYNSGWRCSNYLSQIIHLEMVLSWFKECACNLIDVGVSGMRLRASGPQFVSGRSGFKALGVGFKVLGFEGLWVWGFRAWAIECRFFFLGGGGLGGLGVEGGG